MDKKILKINLVLLAVFVLGSSVYASSANITQINFTNSPQTIDINTISAQLTTQTQNAEGELEQTDETNHLNLSSSSATGEFSSSSTNWNPINQLTMSTGSANRNFYYRDSTPGTHTLTVSAEGQSWTSATQEIIITGESTTLSSIAVTTPANKLSYTVGDSLDITGLIVTGTYSDGSTKIEDITISNMSGFDSTVPVIAQILTITIGDQTTTYTVDINTATNTPNPVSINLKVYADNTFLFNNTQNVTACAESEAPDAPVTVNGKCAIEQSGLTNTWTWDYAPSGWLDELDGYTTSTDFTKFWNWFSNLNLGGTGLNQHILSDNEELLLTYNSYPLRITASQNSGVIGDTITFTVEEKSTFDANYNMIWTPSTEATVTLGTQSCVTVTNGTCSITLDTTGSLTAVGSKNLYVPSANINITVSNTSGGGNNGGETSTFNIENALDYLVDVQNTDGSFGEADLYSDWAAIAIAVRDENNNSKSKLLTYLNSHNTLSSLVTDNERRAMALLALGENPYSFNGVNYIQAILDSFDGTQFGESDQDNDDIFALIPLANAGYDKDDEIIIKDIAFVISAQNTNGSWDNSPDMTAAAIQALQSFKSVNGVPSAISKAKNYLINTQNDDGGWGFSGVSSVFSTSWIMQAMSALDESWTKNDHSPLDYLAAQQETDGAVSPSSETLENRIWATSYAIAGASLKPWSEIMQSISKPAAQTNSDHSTSDRSENTTPTTTPEPVPCPAGDLFSRTTGQPCTVVVQTIPVVSPQPVATPKNIQITNVKKVTPPESPKDIIITDEIISVNPDTLTAAAINTLPEDSAPRNTVPIALGVISGIGVLYIVTKLLVK